MAMPPPAAPPVKTAEEITPPAAPAAVPPPVPAPPEKEEETEKKKGFQPGDWFRRLKEGLDKTRKSLVFKVQGLLRLRNVIDEDFWEELEDILITADVGMKTTAYIIEEMKKQVEGRLISEPSHLIEVMKDELCKILEEKPCELNVSRDGLSVIMVVGVNGTGKTTSIAKLANRLMQEDKKVLVAAADTFRAAAIEQLEVWSKKLDVEIIKHNEGADPAAVVFDSVSAATARKADALIIDTAGRLHSKVNLMKELEKINRVVKRTIPDGPHETLLVLDATNGQNALVQARTFSQFVDVSGIVLTKLDGTAKGGIIIGIVHELGIPVKFIGIGEGVYDLRPFNAKHFMDALFSPPT
jgi:fused signal recognition particle receptor